MTSRAALRLCAGLCLGLLAACTVGPNYRRPTAPVPASYKELEGWQPAHPRPAASGTAWWSIYDDPLLDGLERQIDISNETLKASAAAFREASAVAAEARAGYSPSVAIDATAQRASQGVSSASAGRGGGRVTQNQFDLTPSASWEPDLWGRIRRTVENAVANAQASAADLAAARLSAEAQLAADYLQLRVDDALKGVLDATIAAYQRSLDITRNQYNAGVVAQTDVITAETQLQGAQAQAINIGVQRALLEHAIAVLIGKPPSQFSIAPVPLKASVPVMPPGVPSTLLERRPDIAAAERAVAAANAEIGVAESAYFPTLTLTASFGFASTQLASLFEASNSAWSLGGDVSETLFDGGLRGAQLAAARAAYDQSVADYRQTVLAGFQQVEDELATLRILAHEAAVEAAAAASAEAAVRLTLNQYQAGTVAYTSVVVAQATALGDRETELNILASRLTASVTLVEALGGGWTAEQLPRAGTITAAAAPPPVTAQKAQPLPQRFFQSIEKWFTDP